MSRVVVFRQHKVEYFIIAANYSQVYYNVYVVETKTEFIDL